MFNAKRDKIIELEKEIDFHKKVAGVRQDKLVNVRLDCERLRAKISELSKTVNKHIETIKTLNEAPPMFIDLSPLEWTHGEPKEQGWYFVAWKPMPLADTKTTALFYNPAARCKWMRGEKGNAERFEQEVIAYIEAPEYEENNI